MKSTPRTRKLNESLKEAVAAVLIEEISDPRLALVTVTGANVSPDMRLADIYVTAHGDSERYAEVLEGLKSANRRIRTGVSRRVRMKYLPELRFHMDESVDEGMRIYEALRNVPPTLAEDEDAESAEAAGGGERGEDAE